MKRQFDINWSEKRPGFLESACILSQLNSGKHMENEQEKSALEWVRRQAREIDGSISENESVFYCTRIISAELENKKSSEISRDNEIKMLMAKQIFCSSFKEMPDFVNSDGIESLIDNCCKWSEQIFNRFNK